MEKLKEKLWEELEEIARKPEMGAGDLELAHKLTDTIKNIDKICMLEDGEGYSEDGGEYGRGSSIMSGAITAGTMAGAATAPTGTAEAATAGTMAAPR